MKTNGFNFFLSFLFLITFTTTSAEAKPGKGKGGDGSEPPTQTSCADYDNEFPDFAYTKADYSNKGQIEGNNIYLSNSNGTCSVLLVALPGVRTGVLNLKFFHSGTAGKVVWRQHHDESVKGKFGANRNDLIRMATFEIVEKELISIEINTVKNSGSGDIGYNSIDLSSDGQTLLVIQASPNTSGQYFNSIHEMDISECSSDCPMENIFEESLDKILLDASYNDLGSRIYFSGYYRFLDSLGDFAGQGFISFIENVDGQWSEPRLVTIENNGYYSTPGESHYAFPTIDVALVDVGNEQEEAVVHTFADTNIDPPAVHLINIGTCVADGTLEDCVSSGESSTDVLVDDGEFANFGEDSIYFSSASSMEIYRYDLPTDVLEPIGTGNESDARR